MKTAGNMKKTSISSKYTTKNDRKKVSFDFGSKIFFDTSDYRVPEEYIIRMVVCVKELKQHFIFLFLKII